MMTLISDRPYRYQWLKERYKDNICFFRAGNKRIALVGTNVVPQMAAMQIDVKIPLWKQAMNMQMGRKPAATRKTIHTYRTEPINNPEKLVYSLWEQNN